MLKRYLQVMLKGADSEQSEQFQLSQEWADRTVSEGTLVIADIVASIDAELRGLDPELDSLLDKREILDDETFYEALDYYLESIAPDGCYFGTHPDDGALIGFWRAEDEQS